MSFMNPRYTFAALMSLLLAIALATLSVAQSNESPDGTSNVAPADSTELQKLVNELVGHIESLRHLDHRDADRRLKKLTSALEGWNASGQTAKDAQAMRNWLEGSSRVSLPGLRRQMPLVPVFSKPVVVQVVPTPEPTPLANAARDVGSTPDVAETPNILTESPTNWPPLNQPQDNQLQAKNDQPPLPWAMPLISKEPEIAKAETIEKPKQVAKPQVARSKPQVTKPKPQIAKPEVAKPQVIKREVAKPKVAEKPDQPSPAPRVAQHRQAPRQSSKAASIWKRHPGAKKIDLSDPFSDEGSSPDTGTRVAMRPATMTVGHRTRVEVNNMELSARMRGYVHGLRGVEAQLQAESKLSAEKLLRLVRELRQLGNQREMLLLYRGSVASASGGEILPTLEYAKRTANTRLGKLKQAGVSNEMAIETIEAMLLAL